MAIYWDVAGTTIDCSTTTWRGLGHRMRWLWRRSTSCGFPSSSSPTRRRTRPPWAPRTPRSPSQGSFFSTNRAITHRCLWGSTCLHADEKDNYLVLLNINQPHAMKTNSVKGSRTGQMMLNQQTKEMLWLSVEYMINIQEDYDILLWKRGRFEGGRRWFRRRNRCLWRSTQQNCFRAGETQVEINKLPNK